MENSFYIENDVYAIVAGNDYDIAVLVGGHGVKSLDSNNDNVDVEVRFKDGRLYTGTFFTIRNLEYIFEKNKQTGECDSGLYFYCVDMILVEELTLEKITATVKSLLEKDSLECAFNLQEQ